MRMKKLKRTFCLLVFSLMLFATASLTMAAEPKDVPADHWAYKAVKLLVDKGYLQLYQDQTFQGEQPVDRYTLAVIVAKILNEVASGSTGASSEDIKTLRNLTNELREELVKIIADNSTYSKKTDEMKRKDRVINEDLITTNVAVQNLSVEQKELRAEQIEMQNQAKQILADLKALQEKVSVLEKESAQLKAEITQLKNENQKQRAFLIVAVILGLVGVAK